jgi:uncharacterized membrane protein
MQWIFMLVGLVLGALVAESPTGAVLGGLVGLGIAQALTLRGLQAQNAELAKQLKRFAERFEQGTQAIHERLLKIEPQPAVADELPPAEMAPAVFVPSAEPELSWELPPEILAQTEPQPAPAIADAWTQSVDEARAAPVPPKPVKPRAPSLIARAIAQAQAWLFGGNTVLRIGVLLLFLGLAFLLRYATEGMVVPVQVRYAGVAASAIVLLGLGWWLRLRNPSYGLMLQGAGIAVLYLTIFAAMRLHPLLEPAEAFALLLIVTLCSAILAVTQNALGLAAAAALGGFAAPILTSTGSGNHVALFSYFVLLNSAILAIAWFKAWRLLNLIGFVGTFGIGFAWGLRAYIPELLGSTEALRGSARVGPRSAAAR